VSVAERFAAVRERALRAAERVGRDPRDVTIVAVSKTFTADVIAEALDAGVTDLGENRAQELAQKVEVVGDRARWHFIGHLQTNKVRHVVGVHLIHSIDRAGVAEAIDRRARSAGRRQDVLIEVNVAGDPDKHGVMPSDALDLARALERLDGVRVRGLMTMPPLPREPEDSRPHYKHLAVLRDEVVTVVPAATELSMGMTRDFEVAIEEGATIVRIGEAIFGRRD
jgi:PLP dependent protein